MKIIKSSLFVFGLAMLMYSCTNCESQKNVPTSQPSENEIREQLINANRSRVEVESDRIDGYVKRRKWDMQKSGTGLRYIIYRKGNGPLVKEGNLVKVNFEVSLINGDICYSSDSTGADQFKVGMDHVETGLHEAMLLMNKGAKAKFILPSHLAYGLLGDENKIPSNATVIYDIELLDFK